MALALLGAGPRLGVIVVMNFDPRQDRTGKAGDDGLSYEGSR